MKQKANRDNTTAQPPSPTTASTTPTFRRKGWLRALSLTLFTAWLGQAHADTFISGTINTTTWTPSGSPYKVIGNCNVPCGQVLTIQPGVTVIISTGLEMDIVGQILALGSPMERITFLGQDTSHYWNRIFVNYGDGCGGVSRFNYCNFNGATYGLYIQCNTFTTATMATEVSGCSFSNCASHCIYGYTEAYYGAPHLNPVITDCAFSSSTNGVLIYIRQGAQASPTIANNLFQGISGTGVQMYNSNGGSSSGSIFNNVFMNCTSGFYTADPFDCIVENNVFSGSSVAVQRSGSLSINVAYNCFFNNATAFLGYPAGVYGTICGGCVNHNGTPCDPLYNIFVNPQFCETTNFTLSASSPCIDAGDPGSAFLDVCFASSACSPGSLGTSINDIGIYGGPYACPLVPGRPTIVTQPSSQSSCLGGSATFSVTAAGPPQLGYQWYFNGGSLSGKTSQSLTLTSLQATQAGPYTVVVTNVYGAVTSAPAQLMVNDACVDLHMYAGLTISGQQGATYYLKSTTNLSVTNWASWTPLATNVMGSSNWFYVDMASPFLPKRFYGVRLTP